MERNGHIVPPPAQTVRAESLNPKLLTWGDPAPSGVMFGRDNPALRPAFTAK